MESEEIDLSGISKQDLANTDVDPVSKDLNIYVETIAWMVKVNPRVYENQGTAGSPYNIMAAGKAFARCHELITTIAANWTNMIRNKVLWDSAELYFDAEEEFYINDPQSGKSIFCVTCGEDMAAHIWSRFLVAAASCVTNQRVTDDQLCRFIKDAADYGVKILLNPAPEDDTPYPHDLPPDQPDAMMEQGTLEKAALKKAGAASSINPEVDPLITAGLARLTSLYHDKAHWQALPTTRMAPKKIKTLPLYDVPQHLHNIGYNRGGWT